jgi:peptide/nickel transport system substrate-binding protein
VLLLTACDSAGTASTTTVTLVPVTGGRTTVGIDQAPTGCNPNTTVGNTWATRLVLAPVLPSPFVVDDNGNSVGNQALATSAELVSTKPQTIVYSLNPKATWSDGVPITAADFIFAWEEQRGSPADPNVPLDGAASSAGYRDIKSVKSSNHGRTVTVVFQTPYTDWQMLFNNLLPAHVLERIGWDPPCSTVDPAVDLSGGPYQIQSVTPTQVVLVANPRWWDEKPNLTRITIRIANGPAQLSAWKRRGVAQVVQPSDFGPAFLQVSTADALASSQVNISSSFLQLEFSTTAPATVLPAVRQALAHAVDRQALVQAVVGFADPNIVPAQSHLYVQTQNDYPQSPTPTAPNPLDAASATTSSTTAPAHSSTAAYPPSAEPQLTAHLLSLAGDVVNPAGQWTDPAGVPLTFRMVVDGSDSWALQTSDLVAHQLEKVGLGVTVAEAPSSTAAGEELAQGAADMALLPFDTSPYSSVTQSWYTPSLGPPGQNGSQDWSNLDDPTLNALFDKAVNSVPALNPVQAAPSYTQADQLLWTEMVALPLFAEPSVLVWSNRLDNVTPNVHGPGLLWNPGLWELQVPKSSLAASAASS